MVYFAGVVQRLSSGIEIRMGIAIVHKSRGLRIGWGLDGMLVNDQKIEENKRVRGFDSCFCSCFLK